MAPKNSTIQITSSVDIDNETLHEKIVDHTTGKVKTVDKQDPHSTSRTTTVASNPVKYETKGTEPPKLTSGHALQSTSTQRDPAAEGLDTSAL
ncbi:ribose 5-phosphate isomerase B [Teratosphaeria destructans]|uniref:Ribose 5-phosphate isomerase B n=1 Tax=Teratosphaeria destructans TaxID=418781 RepID=A0A9W7W5E5_9PEZI|nr:ribose 5-phosphate isomerase B [Teratosphaeria destructans]